MDATTLLEAVRRHVADLGFELVEFRKSGPPQRPVIQVRIDRPGSAPGAGITTEDCARTTRSLAAVFEEAAGLGDRYQLEVSSPGIERPVRFPEHWRRYVGRAVKLTARSVAGHPRAVIVDVPDDRQVRLRLPDGAETMVAFADIKEALLQEDDSAAGGRREP
jgi:ribosome maturation factor RimP